MHSAIYLLGGRRLGNYIEHNRPNNDINDESNMFLSLVDILRYHITPDVGIPVHSNVRFANTTFFL